MLRYADADTDIILHVHLGKREEVEEDDEWARQLGRVWSAGSFLVKQGVCSYIGGLYITISGLELVVGGEESYIFYSNFNSI